MLEPYGSMWYLNHFELLYVTQNSEVLKGLNCPCNTRMIDLLGVMWRELSEAITEAWLTAPDLQVYW